MTFKKQFAILVFIVLFTTVLLSALFFYFQKTSFIEHEVQQVYKQRKSQFNSMIRTRKMLLMAVANSLTLNSEVHKAYKRNDREILIKSFESMWRTFQDKELISEIHFFKTPVVSFVNFSNIEKYNIDVKDVRQDIDWVSSSFTPSTHFLVCRLFPGLRATYPIVIDNVMYGSVSLGIDLNKINDYIHQTHPEVVSYFLLDDEKLKKSLLPQKYSALVLNRTDFKGFKVFGTKKNIEFVDIKQNYILKEGILYSVFPISDFDNKVIGYFIYEDKIESFITVLFNYTLLYIIMFFILGFVILHVFWRLLSSYNYDIHHILELLESLNNKDFKTIEQHKLHINSSYVELQTIEKKIFQTSDDIEMYIELLSKEIEDYSDKAFKDVLTKAFNRRALEEIGSKMLTKNKLALKSTSMIMLDIDNFKNINDTYGHSIGDIALESLSSNIQHILRKDDLFARYGGEEFVILLPFTSSSEALDVAEKLRSVTENDVLHINDILISFTISIGVSESTLSDIELNDFIKETDAKLYEAKHKGKNCVVI